MIIPNNTNSVQQINFLFDRNALNGKSSVLKIAKGKVFILKNSSNSIFVFGAVHK